MNMDFNHLSTSNVGFPHGPLDRNPDVTMIPPVMMPEHFHQQLPAGMFPTQPDPNSRRIRNPQRSGRWRQSL